MDRLLPTLFCAWTLFSALQPAYADQCVICDTTISLSSRTKDCLLENIDRYFAEMDKSAVSYVTVDFEKCPGNTTRGLITLPTERASGVKSSFILDRSSLRCLYRAVTEATGTFDPSVNFDLKTICVANPK
jgi:hypothetical protein